ncbi:MAG: hypothetical protein ABSD21_10940 [Rhizomicrobium sp.]
MPARFRPGGSGYAPLLAGAVPFDAGPEPWNATVRQMCGALERQLKKLEKSKPRPDRPDISEKNARTLDMLVRLYERLLQRQTQVAAMRFPGAARNNEGAADELERRLDRLAAANAAYPVPEKPG